MEPTPVNSSLTYEGLMLRKEFGEEALNASLHNACELGNVEDVAYYLDRNVSPNVRMSDRKCQTAYHAAIRGNHTNVVTLLAEKRADPSIADDEGATPLKLAAEIGNEIGRIVLSSCTKIDDIESCFNTVIDKKNLPLADEIIDQCPHPSISSLHKALLSDLFPLGRKIIEKSTWTSLEKADLFIRMIKDGNKERVSFLLQNGFDPNGISGKGCGDMPVRNYPLLNLAQNENLVMLKLLLENGAEVNQIYKDKDGAWFALGQAAYYGNNDTVSCLLKHKAKINLSSDGKYDPLRMAIRNSQYATAQQLILAGADLDWEDKEGIKTISWIKNIRANRPSDEKLINSIQINKKGKKLDKELRFA